MGTNYRAYLQFDLTPVPAGAVIESALLMLYHHVTNFNLGSESQYVNTGVYQLNGPWQEDEITWDTRCGYKETPESTCTVPLSDFTWFSWDITDLLQTWLDGAFPNYGVVLKSTNETDVDIIPCYHSSDYTSKPDLRPKLEITYHVPQG